MKYTILINQRAWAKVAKGLTILEMAILDYMIHFSSKSEFLMHDGEKYFWFSWKKMSEDMPILHLNNRMQAYRKVENLVEAGMLWRHPDNTNMGKAYFAFSNLAMEYFGLEPATNSLQGVTKMKGASVTNPLQASVTNSLHNKTINSIKPLNDKEEKAANAAPATFSLQDRLNEFLKKVDEQAGDHPPARIERFKEYWTEPTKSGKKMRFEDEKYFDIPRRLNTFKRFDEERAGRGAVPIGGQQTGQTRFDSITEAQMRLLNDEE